MPSHYFTLFALPFLSACGSLVTSTLLQVGALDPFTADPAGFAVGMDTASGLSLVEWSVNWTFEAIHSPSGETRTLVTTLLEDRSSDGLVVYRLRGDDVEALRRWQQELTSWKETSDGNSSLGFYVSAEGCRIPGATIASDPEVSIFIQLAQDAPMRPLARNIPVMDFFEAERADIDALPLCIGGPF